MKMFKALCCVLLVVMVCMCSVEPLHARAKSKVYTRVTSNGVQMQCANGVCTPVASGFQSQMFVSPQVTRSSSVVTSSGYSGLCADGSVCVDGVCYPAQSTNTFVQRTNNSGYNGVCTDGSICVNGVCYPASVVNGIQQQVAAFKAATTATVKQAAPSGVCICLNCTCTDCPGNSANQSKVATSVKLSSVGPFETTEESSEEGVSVRIVLTPAQVKQIVNQLSNKSSSSTEKTDSGEKEASTKNVVEPTKSARATSNPFVVSL